MSESQEQIIAVKWAKKQRKKHPEIRWLHHIPNGGKRGIRTAMVLKLEGVEAGVHDLFLPVARHDRHGLYIEVKFGSGKMSDLQKEFKEFVIGQGYATATCYTGKQIIKVLKKYLDI